MSNAVRTLVINQLSIPLSLVDNQKCGGADGSVDADIEISAEILTREGWVIEVEQFSADILQRFGDYMLKATCEELADGIVRIAYDKMGLRLATAKVKVYNLTGYVETSWKRGDAVPNFPQRALPHERERTEDNRARGFRRRSAC